MAVHDGLILPALLSLETSAARLEAALDADPGLAGIWRAQAALTEAAASLRLEGFRILEGDILLREKVSRAFPDDVSRGAEAAAGLLSVLGRPDPPGAAAGLIVPRCWRAGGVSPVPDLLSGRPQERSEPPPDALGGRILEAALEAPTAFLAALRGACLLRGATFGERPAAERLVFMACEHHWRRSRGHFRAAGAGWREDGEPEARLDGIAAGWTFLPSVALARDGFRAWSPSREEGLRELLGRLAAQSARDLGSLPVLRRWRARAQALTSGRGGKSRMADLVRLVMRRPVIDTAFVAEDLGITRRGALKLIGEAVEGGVLAPLVPRPSWRVWAARPLAEILRSSPAAAPVRRRAPQEVGPGDRADRPEDAEPETRTAMDPAGAGAPPGPEDRATWAARETAVLARLDAALAEVDALLEKYRK